MSVKDFDKFNDNSLVLMFVFGIPLLILLMIVVPELKKLPEPLGVILGFLFVLSILFIPPKISYFILRKSNPYSQLTLLTDSEGKNNV